MLKKIFSIYSSKARKKRAKLFNSIFNITEDTSILDLGGDDGKLMSTTVVFKKNVCIADINKQQLENARQRGYKTLELNETGIIPCVKNEFDIIFCNSVIEHVTVNKEDIYKYKSNQAFRRVAFERQKLLADEIQSKCDKYYVQTPYKYFLIESHSWLPVIIVFLPRKMLFKVLKFFGRFWPKKTEPDWNLLTIADMKKIFPGAKIIKERSFFMVKSLIAVKK